MTINKKGKRRLKKWRIKVLTLHPSVEATASAAEFSL
jgi:hypothetical protein